MKLDYLLHEPTEEETVVFKAVSPIIEKHFPKATAYISLENEIHFNCGHNKKCADSDTIVFIQPDVNTLDSLSDYLNNIAEKQNSIIGFQVWAYDYGEPVPAEIVAKW